MSNTVTLSAETAEEILDALFCALNTLSTLGKLEHLRPELGLDDIAGRELDRMHALSSLLTNAFEAAQEEKKMKLEHAIELAASLAYEADAEHYVVNCEDGYKVLHNEDPEAFAPGVKRRFTVNGEGVDPGHIERGEITENWEIPGA